MARLEASVQDDDGPEAERVVVTPDAAGADILVGRDPRTRECRAEVFGFKTRAIVAGGGPARDQMAIHLSAGSLRRLFGIDASTL